MFCPKCNEEIKEGSKFCSKCGNKIKNICSNCGGQLSENDKFCSNCGANVINSNYMEKVKVADNKIKDKTIKNIPKRLWLVIPIIVLVVVFIYIFDFISLKHPINSIGYAIVEILIGIVIIKMIEKLFK